MNTGEKLRLVEMNIKKLEQFDPEKEQEQEQYQEQYYDFEDLLKAIDALTNVHDVTTNNSDIFEHTMLRLAGVSFPFDGYYKFYEGEQKSEYFCMNFGLSRKK